MIAAVFFSLLFIALLSFVLVFIFYVLFPALKKQGVSVEHPFFNEREVSPDTSDQIKFAPPNGQIAAVLCAAEKDKDEKRFSYAGPKSCSLFFSILDTEGYCEFACAGFGDCTKACPRDAISVENGCAVVNQLCNGCGKCLSSCPRSLITLVPADSKHIVLCSSPADKNPGCSSFALQVESFVAPKKHFFPHKS